MQVIKAMLTLTGLVHKATAGVSKHVDGWRRYQHLWKQDKAATLDKFTAKQPTCVEFEEKLAKYSRVRRSAKLRALKWQIPSTQSSRIFLNCRLPEFQLLILGSPRPSFVARVAFIFSCD